MVTQKQNDKKDLIRALVHYRRETTNFINHNQVQNRPVENVLLIGATGYLGTLICKELSACRSRRITVLQHLKPFLGVGIAGQNVQLLYGNITQDNLGINESGQIYASIDTIINCSGVIYENPDIYAVNDLGISQILAFARNCQEKVRLLHISTLGVGAGYSDTNLLLSEYDHVSPGNYLHMHNAAYYDSKNRAENRIIKNENRISYNIFRMGNLTFHDEEEKVFINRRNRLYEVIRFFLDLKMFPDHNTPFFEVTNARLAAKAIVLLATNWIENRIFHLCSPYTYSWTDIAKYYEITTQSIDKCMKMVSGESASEINRYMHQHLQTSKLPMNSAVVVSDLTRCWLEKLNFVWPDDTNVYLKQVQQNSFSESETTGNKA